MGKATSLVELILKKWGDDTAGAAKELERLGGYPESVANRIATGDLPMDEASRMARAAEQGYGDVLYHGSTNPDLVEIEPMIAGKRNATGGNGLFLSDNPKVASTYAYDARVNGGTGPIGGTVYPLRVRDVHPSERVTVADRGHRGDRYSYWWDDILPDKIRGMNTDGFDDATGLSTDQINRNANKQGKKVVEYRNMQDSAEDAYGIGGEDVPSNVTAVLDNTLVRSPSAAFDPQYTGPNIMGNADPRLLAGTAAGTAGLLAAPMIKDSGMISAPRSENLFNITMGARDLERRLEGSPASLLFPSGLVEYLETVNRREEKPNAMTRGMALLDLF